MLTIRVLLLLMLSIAVSHSCNPPRESVEDARQTIQHDDVDTANDPRSAASLRRSLEQYRQVNFDRSGSLDRFLREVKDHYRVPALAAAVTTLDGIQSKAAVGVKCQGRSELVSIDDIFCIGSCAKSMTAMMVASIVDDGLLNWHTRPIDVFPELANVTHADLVGITVKQLLSHSAGVRPFVSDEDYFSAHATIEGLTGTVLQQRRRFAFWNLKRSPATRPGSFAYSNGGYVIAAAMAERVTGVSWETLMKTRVFDPLNLRTAFIGLPQEANVANVRRYYYRDSAGDPLPLALDARPITRLFHPAGIVSVSITDFANYALYHLRGLNGVGSAFNSETVHLMHRALVQTGDGGGYGLGWNIINTDDVWISTHSGGDSSVYAVIVIDRMAKVAGVVMCNMGDSQASAACANVMLELMP